MEWGSFAPIYLYSNNDDFINCYYGSLEGGKITYPNIYEMLLWLNLILGLFIFIGHINYDISDGAFREFFTLHMIYTAGICPTLCILILLFELFQFRNNNVPSFISASFLAAIILFLSGGLIGSTIAGVNVTIPAHYHGSIVGISLAFMGLTYLICFRGEVQKNLTSPYGVINNIYESLTIWNGGRSSKLATKQIYVICIGQLLHIIGLALAGGYGVMRKSPDGSIALSAKFYMGMCGGGGLIAIIGGLLFVYICVKNLFRSVN